MGCWPNSGSLAIGKVHQGQAKEGSRGTPGEFEYEGDRPKRWTRTDDIWMFGAWEHLWAGNYLKVARLDPDARRVTTAQASSYGFREGNPFYFLNVLEELDQPGEWYLDRESGLLYVLPPADLSKARVDFPLLAAPFVTMQDVRNVTLRGLIFEVGRAEGAVITGGEQVWVGAGAATDRQEVGRRMPAGRRCHAGFPACWGDGGRLVTRVRRHLARPERPGLKAVLSASGARVEDRGPRRQFREVDR